ncbi:NAD(P)H-hydrate dehydratase [Dongia rigui]|uniref:NAD(P)H-hydrate dehydratase n=1 Tax=Dongia rigui TaxID=940149 RepID=UPI002A6A49F8|nr:NAD(P)H-hydrate dehydratase [Dongia rigui]
MVRQPVVTSSEMRAAERAYFARGNDSYELMRRAGAAVADAISRAHAPDVGPVLVLCGPGNNGGDGFVIADLLRHAGFDVQVAAMRALQDYQGDAATAAAKWGQGGNLLPFEPADWPRPFLVVDALFGIGLDRKLEGKATAAIDWVNRSGAVTWAVDVPSGISADDGRVLGAAIRATNTVTFGWAKVGHLLLPGRAYCGTLVVAPIGLDETIVPAGGKTFRNDNGFWGSSLPRPGPLDHKYSRGHALVIGSSEMPGAGRLAALGARRIGAGMLSVAAPAATLTLYMADQPGIIAKPAARAEDLVEILMDRRISAVLVGSGLVPNTTTREGVITALSAGRPAVVDGGGLTAFADRPDDLFTLGRADVVLTPHEGEFRRLFPDLGPELAKVERARRAAARAKAVIVLKGADTVIAAPDGSILINDVSSPYLATAGSGDVLAGLILGLLAQGMPAYPAAAAAVWFHGKAGLALGPGLIAEDLPGAIPALLAGLG